MAARATDHRRWMRGASSPLRGALLGLILERPGHGGELASRLTRRLGETWHVEPTDVYRLLRGLEQEGVVCAFKQPSKRDHQAARVVYHPSEHASSALTLWLETLVPREPMRCTLHAKLSAARDERDARLLVRALNEHERECLAMAKLLPSMVDAAGSWRGLFLTCLRQGVWSQLQAEIDWARQTRERISDFASEG